MVTGSKDCKINSLDVSNCAADAQSCDFPRGQTINMTLKFTTTSSLLHNSCMIILNNNYLGSSVNGLTNAISGYVSGIWVPFKKTNVCDSLGTCPLKTGTAATYILTLSISNDYPKVSAL